MVASKINCRSVQHILLDLDKFYTVTGSRQVNTSVVLEWRLQRKYILYLIYIWGGAVHFSHTFQWLFLASLAVAHWHVHFLILDDLPLSKTLA